jgi:hypothetical protein
MQSDLETEQQDSNLRDALYRRQALAFKQVSMQFPPGTMSAFTPMSLSPRSAQDSLRTIFLRLSRISHAGGAGVQEQRAHSVACS